MLYIIGILAAILLIYGLILFFKRGNKEFNPKLTLRERTELEKMVEKKVKEDDTETEKKVEVVLDVKEKIAEPVVAKPKPIFPSKDIQNEISRFSSHVDIDNINVQHSIRNGVQNFLDQNLMVALEEFSLAIESNSQDALSYYCRGLTKLKLKNYESALSDFGEATKLGMKEPNAVYYRALTYYLMSDLDNAILNFKGYLSKESHSPEAFFDIGICYKDKENKDEAIKNFSLAIQRKPSYELAYFERGLLRHAQGDKEGGCADLKKAFGLGYLEADNYLSDLCKDSEQ